MDAEVVPFRIAVTLGPCVSAQKVLPPKRSLACYNNLQLQELTVTVPDV